VSEDTWKSPSMQYRRDEVALRTTASKTVVPKLGVNYPPGVICGSSGGNAEPKPQCCSVLWAITGKDIFNRKCEKFSLRVIRHNRYLDLGNGSKKFGNHWSKMLIFGLSKKRKVVNLYLYYCPNLHWVPQNFRLGHMRPEGRALDLAGLNRPLFIKVREYTNNSTRIESDLKKTTSRVHGTTISSLLSFNIKQELGLHGSKQNVANDVDHSYCQTLCF